MHVWRGGILQNCRYMWTCTITPFTKTLIALCQVRVTCRVCMRILTNRIADLDKKEKSEFKRALARRKAEHGASNNKQRVICILTSCTEEKVKAMDKDELAGHALEWTEKPLEDSLKWLDMIVTHHKDEVRTHKCAFEVHIRRSTAMAQSILP